MNYRKIENCTWYHVMTYPHVVFHVQSQWKGTCLWNRLIVLNWILYYDIKFLGDLRYIESYGAAILWSGHTMNIFNPCAVSRVVVHKNLHMAVPLMFVIFSEPVAVSSLHFVCSFYRCHPASTVKTVFDQTYCMQMLLRTTWSICWLIHGLEM